MTRLRMLNVGDGREGMLVLWGSSLQREGWLDGGSLSAAVLHALN